MNLNPSLAQRFHGASAFDKILSLEGEVYREQNGRRTLRFTWKGESYFLKAHFGVGWREIFKNLVQLKWPILGAENERNAIHKLESLGVETMRIAGFGSRGWNPARRQSFLITEELSNVVSLEHVCRSWRETPPSFVLKRALIETVAMMAKRLHEGGVNHRDFYICHFLADRASLESAHRATDPRLYLIDLHRAQIRRRTPHRWLKKDLGGLWFSSMEIGLTQRDLYRFLKTYREKPLREILSQEASFWKQVETTARALFWKIHRRSPAKAGTIARTNRVGSLK